MGLSLYEYGFAKPSFRGQRCSLFKISVLEADWHLMLRSANALLTHGLLRLNKQGKTKTVRYRDQHDGTAHIIANMLSPKPARSLP